MTIKKTSCYFIVIAFASVSTFASLSSFDHFLSAFNVDKKPTRSPMIFFGLRFSIDPSTTACKSEKDILTCTVHHSDKRNQITAELKFEKRALTKTTSLPLLRYTRREQWQKNYSLKNQIVESDHEVLASKTRLQEAIYFRLDGTLWPVLIRAFDIVVDNKTLISVTTNCDANSWPLIAKEIESIELSFSKMK